MTINIMQVSALLDGHNEAYEWQNFNKSKLAANIGIYLMHMK